MGAGLGTFLADDTVVSLHSFPNSNCGGEQDAAVLVFMGATCSDRTFSIDLPTEIWGVWSSVFVRCTSEEDDSIDGLCQFPFPSDVSDTCSFNSGYNGTFSGVGPVVLAGECYNFGNRSLQWDHLMVVEDLNINSTTEEIAAHAGHLGCPEDFVIYDYDSGFLDFPAFLPSFQWGTESSTAILNLTNVLPEDRLSTNILFCVEAPPTTPPTTPNVASTLTGAMVLILIVMLHY
jgi:hypothetical protein